MDQFLQYSILGRARERGLAEIVCTDLREFSGNKHGKMDDKPFGGGPGMVLRPQPVVEAVEAVEAMDPRPAQRILLTPQGDTFDQSMAKSFWSAGELRTSGMEASMKVTICDGRTVFTCLIFPGSLGQPV